MPPLERSWPELKDPSYRNRDVFSTENWLIGKRADDGAEGLWRIHDKLYDLHQYIDKHPGGAQWLEITQGTDCTEAFESHHLTTKPEVILEKYFVRLATTPRNSPYTFHERGFYKTLKRRASKVLETLPKESLKTPSNVITDIVVLLFLASAMISAYSDSYVLATFSGLLLTFLITCSHNYIHQRDNWRMYYFNFSLMSVRDWRISHVLSHHGYTNSLLDLDLTEMEPFYNLLPDPKKGWKERYLSWVFWPIAHSTVSHSDFLLRFFHNTHVWSDVIGLIIPALLFIANGGYAFSAILMWTWMVMIGSLIADTNSYFASHRHEQCFHEGDTPRQDRDRGLAMLDVTRVSQQPKSLTLTLIMFGEHLLHHLFPSLDHNLLKFLQPAFMETCNEFGIKYEEKNSLDLFTSEFRQLANNKPKKIPPH